MWYMNEERKMLKEMVKEFTQNEVKPFIPRMENDEYPKDILKKMVEIGLLGLIHEEKYGGSGVDWISFGLVIEEIAKESNTLALLTSLATDVTVAMIKDLCTPEQVDKFVKPAIKGDILLACWATEPCGIFNLAEYETTAVRDGDDWIINGGKIFATNGSVADYGFALCKTGEFNPETMEGLTFFMIPTAADGFSSGHAEHKLGWKGTDTNQVYFDSIRLSDAYRIGPVDKAAPVLIHETIAGYTLYGAFTLGSAEGVYEKTRKYLAERIQNGKSLWETHQVIRNDMAKLWAMIENFKGAVYTALDCQNKGEDVTTKAIALKLQGMELMNEVSKECILLHGGTGTVLETDIERYYRDSIMTGIGCGSNKTLVDFLSNFI